MIRVEVSGDSIPEVADKLLALGHGLRSQHSYEADDAARSVPQPPGYAAAEDAPKVKATRKAKEPEPEPEEQVDPEPLAGQTERVEPGLDFDKEDRRAHV